MSQPEPLPEPINLVATVSEEFNFTDEAFVVNQPKPE